MPKTTPLNTQIQASIETFVAELTVLVNQAALESVSEALGGAAAPRRRGRKPGRPAGKATRKAAPRGRTGARGRRSSEDIEALAARVFAHLQANPGHRLEEIGRALRVPTKELKRPVANLLEAGQLRTEGQKRGTKYFARGAGPIKRAKKAVGRLKAKAKKVARKARKKAGKKKRAAKKKTTRRKTRTKAAPLAVSSFSEEPPF